MDKIKCFACDREIKKNPRIVQCEDDQRPYVGPDCYRKIVRAVRRA